MRDHFNDLSTMLVICANQMLRAEKKSEGKDLEDCMIKLEELYHARTRPECATKDALVWFQIYEQLTFSERKL